MARNEADREDLFAEAVALVRRWEGRVPGCPVPLIAGFKSQGDVSFYFGPDRVYHGDSEGRFRRAFIHGFLYRSHGETLTRMRRHRTDAETALLCRELGPEEMAAFRTEMIEHLTGLRQAFLGGDVTPLRRFPDEDVRLEADFALIIEKILDANSWLAPALVARR